MYKVLIVEDEPLVRKGLSVMIDWKKLGCVLQDCAANGEEGVAFIKRFQPHIVITDIEMPKKNGLEMIEETIEEYLYSPIVLTGYGNFSYVKTSLHFGVCEYLLKPVNPEELETALIKAVQIFKEKLHYRHVLAVKKNADKLRLVSPIEYIHDAVVEKIIDCIAEHYSEKLTTGLIAQKVKYSEALLNKRFKHATNLTINDYLNRFRIQKALAFLKEGCGVQEAAEKCGFSEAKYFYVVFKKYIGYSPKEFIALLNS